MTDYHFIQAPIPYYIIKNSVGEFLGDPWTHTLRAHAVHYKTIPHALSALIRSPYSKAVSDAGLNVFLIKVTHTLQPATYIEHEEVL